METTNNQNATGVQIFQNPAFGQMRVQSNNKGEGFFCLADVCSVLAISNSSDTKKRLSSKGVATIDTLTNGGIQKLTFIDEPNLYRCIFQSRKKEAEAFQDWVVEEVLPTIRKTGGYSVPGMKLRQAADVYPIITFASLKLGEIRTRDYNGKVLFCYVDVWKALHFSNGSILKRYLDGTTFSYLETPTNQGIQVAGYIDEENLSRCLFRCKNRERAATLERWVEVEILPYYARTKPAICSSSEPKPIISQRLCPELSEIIGHFFIVVEHINDYKLSAGLSSETCTPIRIAEQSLNLLKASLKTLYDEAYIKDLERAL